MIVIKLQRREFAKEKLFFPSTDAALARLKRHIFDGYDKITPAKDKEGQPQTLVWIELLLYRILDIVGPCID